MTIYADSPHPVRPAIDAAHANTLASFASTGRWFTAEQRAAIAAEARAARVEAGLQPASSKDDGPRTNLSEVTRHVARQVAIDSRSLDRSFFDSAIAQGMSDTEYVETVGVVSRSLSVDVFTRALGLKARALPKLQSGEPTRQRPSTAQNENAWTDTVPGGRKGGEDARFIYGSDDPMAAPFIYRSLSLVPEEARGLIELGCAQYLKIDSFMDLNFSYDSEITRAEVEVVAGRVSAINECFY